MAFEKEAARIRSLFGGVWMEIHHIGSTSVPGLPAKPIIDLLPVVADISSMEHCREQWENAGYRAWGEYGLPGRRLFTKDNSTGFRTHNLHVYPEGHPDIERHVAFSTYLCESDQVRDEYAAMKREVFNQHPEDIAAYNTGKDDWIKRVEPIAVDWLRSRIPQA